MSVRISPGVGTAIATIAVILAFALSWHLFRGMNPYDSLIPHDTETSAAPVELTGVSVQGRSNGSPSWQIDAAGLTISPDRRDAIANNISDGVFYKDTRPALHFSAQHLEYALQPFVQQFRASISGGVTAWTDGTFPQMPVALRVNTSSVIWDGRTQSASCPSAVSFEVKKFGNGVCQGITIDQLHKTVRFGPILVSAQLPGAIPTIPSPAGTSASASTDSDDSDNVTYSDQGGVYWDENNSVATMIGPVTFHQGAAEVDMTGAVYDHKTDIATSSSPVTITDTDTRVTGDKGIVDFATHIAILKGNVVMVVIPKKSDQVKKDQVEAKKPTTILCDAVNYDYRSKVAHTVGAVTIQQTDRTVTADDGEYDVAAKIVDLVGNVVGKSTDGKVIKAPKAEISVDQNDEWIKATGPITGTFTVPSQDNPLDNTTPKKSKQPVATGAAPAAKQ